MKRTWILLTLFAFFLMGTHTSYGADATSAPKKGLLRALRARDKAKTIKSIKELVSIGGKKSITILLKILNRFRRGDEKLYWILLQGATTYHDPGALKALARFIIAKKRKGLSRDLLFALAQNSSIEVVTVLREVLKKGPYDLQLMAVDQLSSIKYPSSVDALMEVWKKIHKKRKGFDTLKTRIVRSLVALTGQNMGDLYENWKGWWARNRSQGLHKSSGRSTGTVIDRLGKNRHSEYEDLKKLPKERILVIKGSPCKSKGVDHNFDHIEEALTNLNIPHTVATKDEFNKGTVTLKGRMVVLINCSLSWDHCVCPTCKAGGATVQRLQQCTGCDKHIIVSDKLSQNAIQRLKVFAGRGGYIFTEDWVIVEFLQKAWPKLVKKGGETQKEYTVNILPGRFCGSHSYLRGIFGGVKKTKSAGSSGGRKTMERFDEALKKIGHTWKVDKQSPSIKVISPNRVTKILVSEELKKITKGNSAVAVTFSVVARNRRPTTGPHRGEISEMRGGRVLHVISHFGKQESSEDEYTLQNLLVNFITEAMQRWKTKHRK